MGNLRAGLLGLGKMGLYHGRNLFELDGVDLVGAVDLNVDSVETAPGVPVMKSLEELLKLDLDYCVVALPTKFHKESALALAEAGVHALIEKPLSYDSVTSREICDAFSKSNLVGAVGHIERFNPAFQEARKRLLQGELGEIRSVSTMRQGPFPPRITDVGVVMDLASHDVDLSAWIAQSPYATVSANTINVMPGENEDFVSATSVLESGVIATNQVDWISSCKRRSCTINGENGVFVVDTLDSSLTYHANDHAGEKTVVEGAPVSIPVGSGEPLRLEHERFRDAVLGKDSEVVTLDEAARAVGVCEAFVNSASTGTSVALKGA